MKKKLDQPTWQEIEKPWKKEVAGLLLTIRKQEIEIEKLKEFKFMYESLCK